MLRYHLFALLWRLRQQSTIASQLQIPSPILQPSILCRAVCVLSVGHQSESPIVTLRSAGQLCFWAFPGCLLEQPSGWQEWEASWDMCLMSLADCVGLVHMVMPFHVKKCKCVKTRNRGLHVKLGQTASLDDGSRSPCNSKESGSLRTLANPVCFHTLLLRNRIVNENLLQNIPPNRTLLPYLHSLINRGGFCSRTRFL